MRRWWTAVAVVCLVLAGWQPQLSAHELAENNGIAAVLHIPPDDNPVAGRQTILSFEFSSDSDKFDLAACGCVASVQMSRDKQQTASVVSDPGSKTAGQAAISFATAGVYDLHVRGRTLADASGRFDLHYALRVTPATVVGHNSNVAGLQVLLLGLTSLILLTMAAASLISRGNRYKH